MGKNNRQRRAEKRRRRERSRPPRTGQETAFLGPRDLASFLVLDAAEAAEHGERERLEGAVEGLADLGHFAAAAMTAELIYGLRAAWENGWQPADITRAANKRLGDAHGELAAEMITLETGQRSGPGVGMPETWKAQLAELERPVPSHEQRWSGLEALRRGAGLLGLLMHLPGLPCLLPPPSQWSRRRQPPHPPTSGVDIRVLDKVRALLAKAESTEFEEEADALTTKAQELMTRYSIDQAMVAAETSGEEPGGRRIGVDDPYAQGKATLLAAIAGANRCRSVWMGQYGFSTVIGYPNDVDIVEVLYLSLLVQATRAMTASGTVRDGVGRSRTRSFRQSFLLSFAHRIGERLKGAAKAATDEASGVHGSRLLPVLAGRAAAVDDAFEAMFPDLVATSVRISNLAGWAAGRVAADLAHLGPDQQLLPGVAV
jgi:hypothetical protein